MRVVMFLVAGALTVGTVHAQEKKKGDRPVILVTGCVEGSWLRVTKTDYLGHYAERYKLRGPKALLKEMEKEYKGHMVEVIGAVIDVGNTTHRGKVIEVGKKTRITTGAKEVPVVPTAGTEPLLEVDSFRDLKASCK